MPKAHPKVIEKTENSDRWKPEYTPKRHEAWGKSKEKENQLTSKEEVYTPTLAEKPEEELWSHENPEDDYRVWRMNWGGQVEVQPWTVKTEEHS